MTVRLAFLAFAIGILSVSAQTSTSQISGTVRDPSGAAVPGASVTLSNDATGITQKQETTEAGVYAFPSIPVGSYSVKVEAAGFKASIRNGNTVQINSPLTVDFTLEVGAATESVQVSAESERLQVSNAVIGNVVEQKSIVTLPLNGRNPLNLLMYEPGVTQRSGNTVNVNGARSTAVNVTIDGIEANESTNPNPTNNIFRLNPDNVQEFKVTTQNPSAEEGRNSGANVSIATRSGTNQFHGTMFEFFRNTALNAQEFYANAQGSQKPVLQLNQYGFEIGGPIKKNRTFFFGSWQGQKVNFADPVDKAFGESVDLYTPGALNGVFRYWVGVNDVNAAPVINGQRITQNTPLLVGPTGQYAPGVRDCSGPGDRNCVASFNVFANDPLRRGLDASVKSVLGGYPAPNSYNAGDGLNTGIYQWNAPVQVRGPQWLARIDHTINDKHTVFGRWLGAEQNTLNGDPLNGRPVVLPGFPPRGEVFRPANNIAVGFRSVLSPRLVNELTLGFSRWTFLFTQGEANPAFPNSPRFTFNNSDVDYTSNPRTFRAVNTPQIVENLSFLSGSHVMRFGGNFRFYQHNDQRGDVGGTSLTPAISLSRTTRPPVGFTFPAVATATTPGINVNDLNRLQGMVNDLLGIPAGLTQVFMGDLRSDTFLPFKSGDKAVTLWAQGQRAKQYNFYAQDEWKVRKNMTLSYGVRWEIAPPPSEAGGRVYVPNRSIDGSEGPVTFVNADRWFKNFNWGAVAPRFGITYSPDSKTVIRSGYGIAFDALNSFQVTSVAAAVPGQTYRCASNFSGSGGALVTTAGCQAVSDIRLADGFPNEMTPPTVKPSTFLTPPAQVSSNAPPARVFDQNLKLPTVHMWNLMVQRELPGGFVISSAYVGRRGTRLYRALDMNQIDTSRLLPSFLAMQRNVALGGGCRPDGTLASGGACNGAQVVPWIQQGIVTSAFANGAASITDLGQNALGNMGGRLEQTTLAARLRPNQQFAQALMIDNGGDSNYHAGQFTMRKRFDQQGLLFNMAYTLSKSIDVLSIDPVLATVGGGLTTTSPRTPVDARNYDNERARSDFDQRHVLNMTGIYELPFGKGKRLMSSAPRVVEFLLGGWSLNGIYTYQSGEPFTVRSGVLTANATAQSRAALKPGVALPQAKLQSKAGVVGPVFFQNADEFAIPEPGGLGIGRNIFQGPSFWNVDAGIAKAFQVTERVRMVFRTELFNAFNHANFRNPRDASVGSPAVNSTLFGQACCVSLSTASSATTNQNGESWRVVQLALKLNF